METIVRKITKSKIKIKNSEIYETAFTHKSVQNKQSNERLEFIGDSVIGMIVAEYLFLKYPNENEGFLTRIRTKIVSSKGLSNFANILNFKDLIQMNEKAMNNKWNENPRILEDAFEAFVGALYIDKGLETTKKFILNLIETKCDFEDVLKDTNYKDQLMKAIQSKQMGSPIYKTNFQSGPDHNKTFTVQVVVNGATIAEGTDKSKKNAEQNAAMRALKAMELID